MKKNVFYIVFIAVCLALCLTLSVGMVFAGPSAAGANESLAEKPVLRDEEGVWNTDYLSDWTAYFRDRFFLRQELISLDHLLSAKLFGTSGDPGVLLGKDGWLYYADTLEDYTGVSPMTDRELFSAAHNLRLMADYCEENGKQFLFVIAPNKNALYPQFMKEYGARTDIPDSQRLMERLAELGVPTADLFTAIRQKQEQLYFAHDSHWNTKGAALGADVINAAFGIESDYYNGDFSQTVPHEGDLYTMLYPAFTDPEEDFVYGGALDFTFTTASTRPDAILLRTESKAPGSLLAYRDSFGNLLFPFLASSYGTAQFSRSTSYDLTKEADYVLIELVERNLGYLTENLPVMPAPVEAIDLPEQVSGTISATAAKRGDFLQVKGAFPVLDADSPVYVLCGNTAYRAFCLEETGFGLSLPEDALPEYALCYQSGELTMYQIQS